MDMTMDIDMDIDIHTNETHVFDVFRISLQANIFQMPARPGRKNATREKKDSAVAAWSNVSWVIESQFHQLGQSPSRAIARRHFNAHHSATLASPRVRATAFVNLSLMQKCCEMVELSCLTLRHHRHLSDDRMLLQAATAPSFFPNGVFSSRAGWHPKHARL